MDKICLCDQHCCASNNNLTFPAVEKKNVYANHTFLHVPKTDNLLSPVECQTSISLLVRQSCT